MLVFKSINNWRILISDDCTIIIVIRLAVYRTASSGPALKTNKDIPKICKDMATIAVHLHFVEI